MDLREFVREIARTVLECEKPVPGAALESGLVQQKMRLEFIFAAIAERAECGSIEHAEYLTTWAYGKPPQEVEVSGKDGGPIFVIDVPSAVVKRALNQEKRT